MAHTVVRLPVTTLSSTEMIAQFHTHAALQIIVIFVLVQDVITHYMTNHRHCHLHLTGAILAPL